jgi:hypothetical protein
VEETGRLYPLLHQHLVHERHVVGLLSPPSSEAGPSSATPSAINTTTPKTEQAGAALFIRGPVPASAEEKVEVKKLPIETGSEA